MYGITLSSALFLLDRPAMAVSVAAVGVILGWPFSILVVAPITCYCLAKRFKQVFISAAATSIVVLALSVLTDYYYYGKWTSSVFNLLVYNVLGGGESHLYGTEGPSYYLRNGFNNFNFCFVLALLFLVMLPIARKKYAPDLLVVVSPVYIWLIFMSLQPHKEERFLYPIYPLICVAAAAVIESFPDLFRDKYDPSREKSLIVTIAKVLRPVALGVILCASHGRTFSLIHGYSAPLEIYKHLEHHEDSGNSENQISRNFAFEFDIYLLLTLNRFNFSLDVFSIPLMFGCSFFVDSVLCVGSEWHRYPSSFFVPDYVSEIRWIDDGFRGLLPLPFNSSLGGTASAPPYFNNQNKASDEQYLKDLDTCTFFVELQLQRPYPSRGSDLSKWEVLAALPYLDRELSPAKYRSFFIPYLWQHKNVFGMYKLLRRIPFNEESSQISQE